MNAEFSKTPSPDQPPAHAQEELSRRRFFERLSITLSGVLTVLLAVPAVGFIIGPLFRHSPRIWRPVGRADSFRIGETVAVRFEDSAALEWAGVTARTAAWLRRESKSSLSRSPSIVRIWAVRSAGCLTPTSSCVRATVGFITRTAPSLPARRLVPCPVIRCVSPRARSRFRRPLYPSPLENQRNLMSGSWNRIRSLAAWLEDRLGFSALLGPALTHRVPADARWWYVFGSATLAAFAIQIMSGVALAFSYVPSAANAYDTLQFISHQAVFGRLMRGLHYYGASAMVLMVGLHMAQVFLFGSYKFPRELNWVTGSLLLLFTLLMGFSGQLLRWDQTGVWSVVVAAEQAGRTPLIGNWLAHFTLGGDTVGGATLSRFFAIHVFVVPALLFAFIGIHLLLILRHGISEPPRPGHPVVPQTYRQQYEELLKQSGKPFWPDAAWRDVVFSTAMVGVIVLLALVLGPPELGKPPDPSIIAADPRPDWYLLWYFAVLALLPHGTENYFMVLAPLAVGFLLILLPFVFPRGERSVRRRPWAVALVLMVWLMIGTLWVAGARSNWSPNFNTRPLSAKVVGISTGPVASGACLFYEKACLNCHLIGRYGGRRGPNLTAIGSKLTRDQMILRIANGGVNMPAFAGNLAPEQMDDLVAFLQSRRKP